MSPKKKKEIKFGDNDTLSAITAAMIQADYLFLMTDVDCLYDKNPREHRDAQAIRVVEDITSLIVNGWCSPFPISSKTHYSLQRFSVYSGLKLRYRRDVDETSRCQTRHVRRRHDHHHAIVQPRKHPRDYPPRDTLQ